MYLWNADTRRVKRASLRPPSWDMLKVWRTKEKHVTRALGWINGVWGSNSYKKHGGYRFIFLLFYYFPHLFGVNNKKRYMYCTVNRLGGDGASCLRRWKLLEVGALVMSGWRRRTCQLGARESKGVPRNKDREGLCLYCDRFNNQYSGIYKSNTTLLVGKTSRRQEGTTCCTNSWALFKKLHVIWIQTQIHLTEWKANKS